MVYLNYIVECQGSEVSSEPPRKVYSPAVHWGRQRQWGGHDLLTDLIRDTTDVH